MFFEHSIKLIVTDLDGTLLRSDKSVSDYTAQVFRKCRERNIRIAFATARAERITKKMQEKILPDFVISNNGAVMYKDSEIFRSVFISARDRNRLLPMLLNSKEVLQISAEAETCCYSNFDDYNAIPDVWRALNIVFCDFKNEITHDVPKISVECANADFFETLSGMFPDLCFCRNSGENWHQITHKDATKLNAVRHLADMLGVGMEKIAAFGDDNNDIEMLKACGAGVAVANANAKVKAAARFSCRANDDDGVASWIEENIL